MNPALLDTGCLVALLDRRERFHQQCVAVVTALPPPLFTCDAVIAESIHLLRHVHGADQAILEDVRVGTYRLAHVLASRAADVARLMKKYADIPMDLADACLVDLATQTGSGRILTLDSDFRFYRWGRNRPFELLLEI